MRARLIVAVVTGLFLSGCTSSSPDDGAATPNPGAATTASPTQSPNPSDAASPEDSPEPTEPADPPAPPVSVLGLDQETHRGDRLRLGAVREDTAAYTSYDVTYRSRSTTPRGEESYTISGVLNVPKGPGPFPAVVLAHGFIDPAFYERGQGMTRERGYLASRGYVALHVDYRNHAESDDDPRYQVRMRLGYSADVINAVKALQASEDVPVADDRIALFGRSMGGGVILKALVAEPGLVRAAAPWASVSSLEGENYNQFQRNDPADTSRPDDPGRVHGLPEDNPEFWLANSSRPYFDRITEPVLMVHGRVDDTCPPRWATATHRALVQAGVDSQLEWYDDSHAFGPAFNAAMDRTIRFFDEQLAWLPGRRPRRRRRARRSGVVEPKRGAVGDTLLLGVVGHDADRRRRQLHPEHAVEWGSERVAHQDLDRGHVADHDHGPALVRRPHPVQRRQHPRLDGLEGLTALGRPVQLAHPALEPGLVALGDLGERQPVPDPELHLGEPGLLLDGPAQDVRQDVGGLTRAAYRRRDDSVDPLRERRQPVGGGPDLRPAFVAQARVVSAEPAGEPLRGRVRG